MPADYPSPLTQASIQTPKGEQTVHLPSNELFRLEHIFKHHEYGVPNHYLPSEPIVVVDIGANVGLFALYMKNLRPDSVIHFFEPAPLNFELLRRNVGGYKDVHLHPVGLSDSTQAAVMMLHSANTGENSIKCSLSDQCGQIEVPIVAARQAFEQLGLTYIDILKIDTEGCEVEILRSLQERLPYVGLVLLEYHSDEDRRAIDALLVGFNLFCASIATTEGGILKYINRALLKG
ncbi:MAG: FkbM family methyltransferase [Desulfobacteraceae bacterium]|nr:FkbM family methyltransferase [Desulfobacteraceae bacterium]